MWAHGSGVVTGTIQGGQTLEIEGTCAENASEATSAATFTNNGSVYLTASCASSVTLDATGRTFVNGGLFSSIAGAGGARTIDGTVVNDKAFGVASALTHNGATFESDGSSSLLAVNVSSATAFGAVTSTGGFKLGGELAVLVDSGYTPPSGQEFAILNGASPRVGTFATVLSNGPSFSVVYLTTGAKLHTV